MTFKELVASFNKQGTSREELCLEITCESCFASVFDEVNEQMHFSSDVLARPADEFLNFFKTMRKKKGGGGCPGMIVQNSYILLDVLPLILVSDLIDFLTFLVLTSYLKALVYLE